MGAPKASLVVSTSQDTLFPPLGQNDANRQIADAFSWAGKADRYKSFMPPKPHCYDQDIQEEALAWFNKHLKPKL